MQVAKTYYELVELLRWRRIRLGLPQLTIDAIAGFQDGYCGKLERPNSSYGRHARWETMEVWLQTLGLSIVVVPTARPYHIERTLYASRPGKTDHRQLEFDFRS